jgi:hypothetical protein
MRTSRHEKKSPSQVCVFSIGYFQSYIHSKKNIRIAPVLDIIAERRIQMDNRVPRHVINNKDFRRFIMEKYGATEVHIKRNGDVIVVFDEITPNGKIKSDILYDAVDELLEEYYEQKEVA